MSPTTLRASSRACAISVSRNRASFLVLCKRWLIDELERLKVGSASSQLKLRLWLTDDIPWRFPSAVRKGR